ncbi:DUF305 domain-containing protein [Nocardioides litoris]|uniref:DUF305 domain-containing protein n=1 Tax=Nocardioides litoris TaxID=1926648 RepID=UPI00111E12B3|nr:DUF305 domain-containing protein [Nocardioides litoris]
MSTHPYRRALAALAAGAVLALGTTACGDDPGPQDRTVEVSDTEHGVADVAFATDMVQHHAQALSMVDLTVGRDLDPEVEQLAEAIRAAQGPEIEQMADWLTEWGEDVPETMRDHVNAGHDHGGVSAGEALAESMEGMDTDMPGMMSADDMAALADAPDEEFRTRWLEMMVEHHEGAVEMARTEQAEGRYRPAVELAVTIERTQQTEIETMRGLLG